MPKFKEKRLDVELFRLGGQHQKGSHYPLCVFTSGPGWRSPEKYRERNQRRPQEHRGREGHHHAGPQSWASGNDTRDTRTDATVATPEPWQSYQSTPQSRQGVDMELPSGSDHAWPQSGPDGPSGSGQFWFDRYKNRAVDGSWKDDCSRSSSRGWGDGGSKWPTSRGSHSRGDDWKAWGN